METLDDITKEILRLRKESLSLKSEIRKDRTLTTVNMKKIRENAARIKELQAEKELRQKQKSE